MVEVATPGTSAKQNAYDEVPYESYPFTQAHPNRMATVATLFGLRPTPFTKCRVLELGSAAGGNLIPMALESPESEFVGIDLSARQIDDGKRLIEQLGLTNIKLISGSILDIDASYGQFDYVICHGVFSWVPNEVQDKILEIAGTMMTPQGVAYISYNTYPGWHMRGMIRDMMRYHSERFNSPKIRTRQARALLDFLSQSVKQEGSAYAALLKQEVETLRHQADHYLYHEHLEEINEPLYFHQFAERAGSKGLQYLGESRVGTMVLSNFGPDIEKTLRILATDQIMVEQYMDFLRNRMFRETLLVSNRVQPNWSVQPEVLRRFFVASAAAPVGDPGDLNSPDNISFKSPSGMSMATTQPLLKAAMVVLRKNWPQPIQFDKLREEARTLLGGNASTEQVAKDQQLLAVGLLNCYMGSDLIELHTHQPTFTREPGDKPIVSPLARLQAATGPAVTNRRHEVVRLNDLDRQIVPLLDGSMDRAAILDKLVTLAKSGVLTVQQDNNTLTDEARIREAMKGVVDPSLRGLAGHALLIA
ncbi:methyltransferase regulatory domain-containing protein [Tuwongella immobilis]|uniref:Methyltransferase domain-containing protein n=1 Tax=Tuwongella immobilis TaxID=692036 RepID=A0A6C2YUD8_9BACT|nr:methyltransferase regulatory domain-containing protein [Tuwongella immobilis]VIP04482.1 protein related to regulatory domain of methyltransferases : Methyltransferase type 12 OS=Desulfatibacillum alkenivorans (strain AK-01) GN=Dalk_1878 PE=4 SV=1: Methyltransf_31: MethyTransf_Reg [Tuwongella immobilis]VTS06326.1 protein related to regulatory domain of methyltransferases : Methyltransferase type 12 OS=Desulfatibacillum alkenivorans (strain AK-01) GN=Dalk_1878 PE=4 SV=1: Methyltransf_31: MethyTr